MRGPLAAEITKKQERLGRSWRVELPLAEPLLNQLVVFSFHQDDLLPLRGCNLKNSAALILFLTDQEAWQRCKSIAVQTTCGHYFCEETSQILVLTSIHVSLQNLETNLTETFQMVIPRACMGI